MMKEFVIRIDLESQKGIKEGLPKILPLLRKYGVKGSFYLTMGGESNILEILKNNKKMKSSGERKIVLWSKSEKVRMVLFPLDFVASNKTILRKVIKEGHELGIHGWKHRRWTRNLEKIDLGKEIKKAIKKYEEYFGKKPLSWVSPGYNTNQNVLRELEKSNITHISDFNARKKIGRISNIPITLTGENKMPFIEYWVGEKKNDNEIFEIFKEQIKNKELVSIYIHGMFECRYKIKLLEKMISHLIREKYKTKRVIDL